MVSEDGGRAMVWPEDVPAEVARAAEAEARKLGLIKPNESTEGEEAERRTPQPSPKPMAVAASTPKRRDEPKSAKPDQKRTPKPKPAPASGLSTRTVCCTPRART